MRHPPSVKRLRGERPQPSQTLEYYMAVNALFPGPGSGASSDLMIGEVVAYARGRRFLPGFLLADGRSLSVSEYSALYAVIGNTYGGDEMFFNLPDLRASTIIGAGPGVVLGPVNGIPTGLPTATLDADGNLVYDLGETAGTSDAILEEANLPKHNHVVPEPGTLLLGLLALAGWAARRSA